MKSRHQTALIGLLAPALAASLLAQQPHALSASDYAAAERWMPYNTAPLILHTVTEPTWISETVFWYRTNTSSGAEYRLYDVSTASGRPAFNHTKIAAALNADAAKLNFTTIVFSSNLAQVTLTLSGKRLLCDIKGNNCAPTTPPSVVPEVFSPDRSKAAFVRDYNLWVRDVASGWETPLTTDGVKDYGYSTDNSGWARGDRPILAWAPDSKHIATYRQDEREVGEMYLVSTRVGHPELKAWKYPMPGDDKIPMIERVIVDVDARRIVRLHMAPDPRRSSACADLLCAGQELSDLQWSADSKRLAIVSTSRDHRHETLFTASAATGDVEQIFEESAPTYFESGTEVNNWRYLSASNEILWFSEKSGWGHLYLYDGATGRAKGALTSGDWNVTQVLRVDEKGKHIWFLGVGLEPGRDPYFQHLYRVNFDGFGLTLLTPENAAHDVRFSKNGAYFVDTYSTPVAPPVTVVRDASGKLISTVERADISRLEAAGWKPPTPITLKARDGQTDLYGLLYRPTNFDERKKYPIINNIYPGPQTGSVGARDFRASHGDAQSLADLGFIVVQIDGMGTPFRSKKFHDTYFGNMADNTLPDQVAGMKELAARYPWIDLDRAGIWGHSGGGYATADAMFRYPAFFKVGISESGNHDSRGYTADWAEKWIGLLEKKADGTSNYDSQANQPVASNLKGHLLLAHGTTDDNVPPNNTLLVVNELIKANKDFDLIMLPNRAHSFANEFYMVRRRWDYFVRYLLGTDPPHEYQMHPPEK